MGAMLGVVVAGNLLLLVVFWELTSIASFLLIGFWNGEREARRGARMALAITGAGGLALLAGVLMIGRIVGSFELDVVLAAAIDKRRTDRRNYSSWPVPWGDIALMGARAARAGVMLRQFAGPTLHEPPQSLPGGDDAVVIALGTRADDEMARLRAGEATSLVLLSATAMGLASCPVTEPLEVPRTREAVRADVFGGDGHPQMMVRMGWAAFDAEPLPEPPRRPLADVTDWLPGLGEFV
jgi:nitroreductase